MSALVMILRSGAWTRSQRRGQRRALVPMGIVETVPQEMDEAGVARRRREDGGQCLAHPCEAVGDGEEDVLAAARFEICVQVGEDAVNLAHGHPARDDGFLEASDRRFELFGRERPWRTN
jgi:hypothetical protein